MQNRRLAAIWSLDSTIDPVFSLLPGADDTESVPERIAAKNDG